GSVPAALVLRRRVVAVNLLLLDVDEPKRLVALDPHWTFAEFGLERPNRRRRVVGHLAPAGVDEIFVACDEASIVRRKEQREGSDVLRNEAAGQALRLDDLGFPLRRVPFELARRLDVARNDAGDADI